MKYRIILVLLIAVSLTGCSGQSQPGEVLTKPVRVIEVQEESRPVYMEYVCIVDANNLKKYSFKIQGKVKQVLAEKGQVIEKGDLLAQLDTVDLQLAAEAAKNTLDKSQKAYELARENYENTQSLLEAGAVSSYETKKAKLEMDVQQAAFKNAGLDFENKEMLLQDGEIVAEQEGIVADVLIEEGEVIAAGSPAIIVRDARLVIRVGVPQQDLTKIKKELPAVAIIDGVETNGKVREIAQLPDAFSKAYEVEIELNTCAYPLGAVGKVLLETGWEKGVYIPISTVMKSDTDFVYVIKDGVAKKKALTLEEIRGTEIKVKGLQPSDKLVVEGMKRLEEGDRVTVQP